MTDQKILLEGLKKYQFKNYNGYYVHPELGISVDQNNNITVDDLTSLEVDELKEIHGEKVIPVLVDYIKTKRTEDNQDPGFLDEKEEKTKNGLDFEYLLSLVEKVESGRKLLIYTWGKRLKKRKPYQSQRNFNASVLNGRAKGIDLRKNNGLNIRIQQVVSKCTSFRTWIRFLVEKIETDNLHTISINCAKGRHRSVAAAEILKKVFYLQSKVIHLTIS